MTARKSFRFNFLLSGLCTLRCFPGINRQIKGAALRVGPVLLSVLALGFAISAPAVAAADRVALVLGVEDYSSYAKSAINGQTLEKIGNALKEKGFEVEVASNVNNANSRAMLREFAGKADGARVAIVVLAGHGVASAGRAYLLPSNSKIRRASDLLSRGVSVSSVAQIAAKAKHGAVFFFATVADIPSTLQSISPRPSIKTVPHDNVIVVFSTSDKIPVSRVGSVSRQAALDFADAATDTPLTLETLVGAGSAGDVGKVVGTVADVDLTKAPEPAAPPQTAQNDLQTEQETAAREEAERRAREAEQRAREAEARAKEAEERARLEAEKAEEARNEAEANQVANQVEEPPKPAAEPEPANVEALKLVEALLGRSKKKDLQRELAKRGFYKGPIDAIFGDLTRQGIRDFQSDAGAAVTGYLTPEQIQKLIEG